MGKRAKTSRKGKKAWRANISTEDIEDFYEKSNKDALSGGSLSNVTGDDLFYLDKNKDLSTVRKIEKSRSKVLRHESVLQKNPYVVAVQSSKPNHSKKKKKEAPKAVDISQDAPKSDIIMASGTFDLWEDNGESDRKAKKVAKPSIIPAVEIEPNGCSYNPPEESHKDALAQAVAEEMQKVYKDELGPEPVPLIVPSQGIDERDEEHKYFLDADAESDDDEHEETLGENGEIEPRKRAKRVTRVKLNRRARVKEQQKNESEKKKKKALSKEIDS
jgi:nucleolar protein 53